MESSATLAKKLSEASVRKAWDVYSAFQWPESLTGHEWMMSPELTSLYGTPMWDALSEEQTAPAVQVGGGQLLQPGVAG